jgi:hypothetical protein
VNERQLPWLWVRLSFDENPEWRNVAQSGNGIDIVAIYQLLSEVAQAVRSHGEQFALVNRRLDQLLDVVNEHGRTLGEHTRQFGDLNAGLTGLRIAVSDYHGAVVGHGIRYTELDERMGRVERHLKLEPSRD